MPAFLQRDMGHGWRDGKRIVFWNDVTHLSYIYYVVYIYISLYIVDTPTRSNAMKMFNQFGGAQPSPAQVDSIPAKQVPISMSYID